MLAGTGFPCADSSGAFPFSRSVRLVCSGSYCGTAASGPGWRAVARVRGVSQSIRAMAALMLRWRQDLAVGGVGATESAAQAATTCQAS